MQQSYLSPARFLVGGYGIDTSSLAGPALRNTLMRATSIVDTYCHGPNLPAKHDFRGGTITREQHPWPAVRPELSYPGQRRVYLNHRPIRAVSGFTVKFTNNYQVSLNAANDLFVNRAEGYAEVVAVAAVVSGVYPVGINFGLYTPVAEIDYTYGWDFPVEGDVLEASSTTRYWASHGNWDPEADVAVYFDGVALGSGWTANYDDGAIDFAAAPEPGVTVTADYTYLLPDPIEQATGIIATDLIGRSRIAARGMIGLQSIKVAEVAITAMSTSDRITRNGVSVPAEAAQLLSPFVIGTVG